ncbi:MAG: double-strand break repair helicase AddA [Methylobacterium sp.]|nr:double-strand break repair helicase AddA [Methylobacterium sp.]
MIERAVISEELKRRRWLAIQPKESAWVAANAGAGKTSLLRDRVLRLLLEGVPPDRILCLTFTKAAAAEMQGRIFDTLSFWVSASEPALRESIGELLGADASPAQHRACEARARQLFAEAVETPGGLKIQTIHAFAERLLHLLPVESGVPVHFTVLDDAEHASLCEEARRQVVLEATRKPRSRLAQSFVTLTDVLTTQTFGPAAEAGMRAWRKLSRAGELAPPESLDVELEHLLGCSVDLDERMLEERLLDSLPPSEEAQAFASLMRTSSRAVKTTAAAAARLEAYGRAKGAAAVQAALDFGLTDKGKLRAELVPKSTVSQFPGLDAFVTRWAEVVGTFMANRRSLRTARQSRALGDFSRAMLAAYEALKAERRALDFDDLIDRLRRLLLSGHASWVMLKLDAAIEHILVDEAQDTSSAMWDIVGQLADDFFSGEGQVNRPRSLFVVGDQKQSIFSFQGAEPRIFEERRVEFARRIIARPNLVADPVQLNVSFRSAEEVLEAVDAVFADPQRRLGLTSTGVAETHHAAFPLRPGLVECWALEAKSDSEPSHPEQRLAERIARRIAGWLRDGETSHVTGKPIRPGDILILVRTRGSFFSHLMRALSAAGVPVAGADRIKIQSEIGVRDLLAIAQAALLPLDDLTLATVLKTPLFSLDEPALERLCRAREGSLRAEITRRAGEDLALARIDSALSRSEARALDMSPHDFFARLLLEECPAGAGLSGRMALMKRLGADVADALDAFLTDALAFEERHPASLALFLAAQEARSHEIKRDPEAGGDQVRIMTVHGAKGLEAPIVFLTEAGITPADGKDTNIREEQGSSGRFFLWTARKEDEAEPLALERQNRKARQYEEYRRLLYVGLTRARERLYVTGHLATNANARAVEVPPKDRPVEEWPWHALVAAGLSERQGLVQRITAEDGTTTALRWPPRARDQHPEHPAEKPPQPAWPAPDWVLERLARETRPALAVPSHVIAAAREPDRDRPDQRADARREGIFIHRLLQFLPRFSQNERRSLALDLLRQEFGDGARDREAKLVDEVLSLFAHPEFAPFLTPDWRAEVALAGHVRLPSGERRFVPARLDRLRWRDGRIELLDFKTGFRAPGGPDARVLTQMALYRALLADLFGVTEVRCHLGWPRLRHVEMLADAQLDAAITSL